MTFKKVYAITHSLAGSCAFLWGLTGGHHEVMLLGSIMLYQAATTEDNS